MSVVEASGATFRDSRVGRRSIYFSRVENRLVALLGLLHLAFSLCRLVAFATNRYRRILNESFDELESKRRIGRVGVTSNGSSGGTTGSAAHQLVGWADAAVRVVSSTIPPWRTTRRMRRDEKSDDDDNDGASATPKSGGSSGSNSDHKRIAIPFSKPHVAMPNAEKARRLLLTPLLAYNVIYLSASLAAFVLNVLHQLSFDSEAYSRAAPNDDDNEADNGDDGENDGDGNSFKFFNGRMAFYSLCLLDVCVRNAALERVLSAVSLNRGQLAQTALLMIVIIYVRLRCNAMRKSDGGASWLSLAHLFLCLSLFSSDHHALK
jgi:hypothetical protein